MSDDSGPTAFVLAGGGSLGAIEVGMLKALLVHGVRADVVVGSSVGAINAAYHAARPSLEGAQELDRVWRSLRTSDVFPLSPLGGLLGFVGWHDAFIDSGSLRTLLARALPVGRFEDTAIPCHVVATDVLTWKILHRDGGMDRSTTCKRMLRLVRAVLPAPSERS